MLQNSSIVYVMTLHKYMFNYNLLQSFNIYIYSDCAVHYVCMVTTVNTADSSLVPQYISVYLSISQYVSLSLSVSVVIVCAYLVMVRLIV